MSSSTSVFKWPEARVLAVIAVSLLAVELALLATGARLSRDVENIKRISEVADDLKKREAPRVLFVGNSILLAGLDPGRFETAVADHGGRVSVSMVHPDSSGATVWDYLLNRYFVERGALPEDVILVSGRRHLLDQSAKTVELGGYYVSDADIPRFFSLENAGIDAAASFFLGRYSATARLRHRFSPRIFDFMLPHFQENWILLHRPPGTGGKEETIGRSPPTLALAPVRHLEAMARTLRERGVRLTVVQAPAREPYEIEPVVADLIATESLQLADLREIPGIGPESFADLDHLNESGKVAFTAALASRLAKQWIPTPAVR